MTGTMATEDPKTDAPMPRKASMNRRAVKIESKKASKSTAKKKRKVATKTASKKAARSAAGKDEARSGTKKAIVLELLRRKEGATTAEIAKATNWQNHSIRGFISGNVTKTMGLAVESSKNEAGERTYRIAK